MDYSVKTLGQLQPVLRGFRKAAGLTQAMLAERLGITQQSYAQFEANPAAAGVERLFKVLRLLNAGITLSQDAPVAASATPAAKIAPSVRPVGRSMRGASPARKRAAPQMDERAVPVRATGKRAPAAATKPAGKPAPAAKTRAVSTPRRAASASKKREPW
jgi:HTH-type transcriptional regulator/antitoxin HipB